MLLQEKQALKFILSNKFNKKNIIKQKQCLINKQYYQVEKTKNKIAINPQIIPLKFLKLKDYNNALCFYFIKNQKLENLQQRLLIQKFGII